LAKDIFQEVCVVALQKRREIQDDSHLKKWMRITARFYALKSRYKPDGKHLSLENDVVDVLDRRWEQMDAMDYSRVGEALRGCMGALSEQHRQLLEKRFVANQDYQHIAGEMRRSVNSLYTTLSRIYSALAKCISERLALQPR
jgi:RNA polymerase sigma factor (sigma-70 family)